MSINTLLRGFALSIGTLLTACGGGEEATVTVFKELPMGSNTFAVVPGSAQAIQAQLRLDGVPIENPRCADWQHKGGIGGWPGGASPVYLLLDVPESSVANLKQKYAFIPYDPVETPFVALPFFDCKARGY